MRAAFTAAVLAVAARECAAQPPPPPPTPSSATFVPAGSPLVKRTGRVVANPQTHAVTLDWEGTSFSITVANASYVALEVADYSNAGTRFGVFVDAAPSNSVPTYPHLRVLDFLTTPTQTSYVFARGSTINQKQMTYTLFNLIEPQIIGDGPNGNNLTVLGFTTDGVVLPPPAYSDRRIAVLGDSITAAMGGAYSGPCTSGVYLNDFSHSYANLLCNGFGADCETAAWSGIGIACNYGPNCSWDQRGWWQGTLPERFPYVLGGFPNVTSIYQPNDNVYDFTAFVPHAVIVNLGTNDSGFGRISNASFVAYWVSHYVSFVQTLTGPSGWNDAKLPVFIAVGSLTNNYAAAAQQVVDGLNAAGGNATLLNVMVNASLPIGCAGHPSPQMHLAMAAAAAPVMSGVLGWNYTAPTNL